MPARDPDVTGICKVCRGPTYRDEPSRTLCPDCGAATAALIAAHRLGSDRPEAPPRALREHRAWVPGPGD